MLVNFQLIVSDREKKTEQNTRATTRKTLVQTIKNDFRSVERRGTKIEINTVFWIYGLLSQSKHREINKCSDNKFQTFDEN